MSAFTLAISCLTTSNLPWFMDLTFQFPMQYCSLQHWTLLLSAVTSTAGYSFCFGSILSFFLELYLHWSPVAYWAPTDPGTSLFSILSFCLFILFMGFSRGRSGGLVFLSLSKFSTVHCDPHSQKLWHRQIGSGQTGDGKSERRHSRIQRTKMDWNGWI